MFPNERGAYQEFHKDSMQTQKPLIKSYSKQVIAHYVENNGKCKRGFVKGLAGTAARIMPMLGIKSNVMASTMK